MNLWRQSCESGEEVRQERRLCWCLRGGGGWGWRGPEVPNEGHVWNRPWRAGQVWNGEETGQVVTGMVNHRAGKWEPAVQAVTALGLSPGTLPARKGNRGGCNSWPELMFLFCFVLNCAECQWLWKVWVSAWGFSTMQVMGKVSGRTCHLYTDLMKALYVAHSPLLEVFLEVSTWKRRIYISTAQTLK